MSPVVRSAPFHIRAIVMIVLTLTALACVATAAHANMGTLPGQDCSGPGCEQQVACARPDQATAPPSRQLTAPPATIAFAAIEMLPPQSQRMLVARTFAEPNSRSVSPLASRSPPAA